MSADFLHEISRHIHISVSFVCAFLNFGRFKDCSTVNKVQRSRGCFQLTWALFNCLCYRSVQKPKNANGENEVHAFCVC